MRGPLPSRARRPSSAGGRGLLDAALPSAWRRSGEAERTRPRPHCGIVIAGWHPAVLRGDLSPRRALARNATVAATATRLPARRRRHLGVSTRLRLPGRRARAVARAAGERASRRRMRDALRVTLRRRAMAAETLFSRPSWASSLRPGPPASTSRGPNPRCSIPRNPLSLSAQARNSAHRTARIRFLNSWNRTASATGMESPRRGAARW